MSKRIFPAPIAPVLQLLALFFCLTQSALAAGGVNLLGGGSQDPKFLPVDEAFQFTTSVESGSLLLHWKIAEGYYLYKERLQIKVDAPGVVLESPQFLHEGKHKEDPYFGPVEVFYGDMSVNLPIVSTGGAAEITVKVSYQGCADAGLCYPPQTRDALYVANAESAPSSAVPSPSAAPAPSQPAVSKSAEDAGEPLQPVDTQSAQSLAAHLANADLWHSLGLFFLLGIGLAFTPCVFPMVPILSSIVAGQRRYSTLGAFALSITYVLGVATTYAALGYLVGQFGAGANLQAQLQNPYVLSAFAVLFVLLALSMFGFFELQLPLFLRDRLGQLQDRQRGGNLVGVFLMGVLSALVVSPCVSAPLAGTLIYIASTGNAGLGAATLFILALGMGLPLLLVGIGAGHWLPRSGEWMAAVKAVFGVLLLGVAIWLLERFLAGPATLALWGLLAGISAVYLGAFETPHNGWQRLWKGLGLMLFLYATGLLLGALSGGSNPLRPLENFTLAGSAPLARTANAASPMKFVRITSPQQLDSQLEQARIDGVPVMLDFYADWCISCKLMERNTFPNPQVQALLSGYRFLQADVTANDEGNQALLNQFGLFGPPGVVFYDAHGQELSDLRLYGEVDTGQFIAHLHKLPR